MPFIHSFLCMKRTREQLIEDIAEAKKAQKAADKHYYALQRQLDALPSEVQARADKAVQRLRDTLPAYLYTLLVTQTETPLTRLYIGTTCGWDGNDPCNIFEMSIDLGERRVHYEFPFWDGRVTAEDAADESFTCIPFIANVKKAWATALNANGNNVQEALAALITAAVVNRKTTEWLTCDILREVYQRTAD